MTLNNSTIQIYIDMTTLTNPGTQNTPSKGEIILYQTADGKTNIDVKLENETVWLTQDQLVVLFERDKSVISRHIKNISVGYRVKSQRGTQFRIRAS